MQKACEVLGRDIAFIASGDLSHRLTSDAPAGYNAKGCVFDSQVEEILREGAFERLFELDDSLIHDAGECGFRSLLMLAGVFDGFAVETRVLSYEGPYGVGYMIAWTKSVGRGQEESLMDRIQSHKSPDTNQTLSEPAKLAKEAIETFVKEGRIISPGKDLPRYMLNDQAAAFICIKKSGALRGCIGTTEPVRPNLAEEIIRNAIEAACHDPRFPGVGVHELPGLLYTVDVLGKPEPIPDISYLDCNQYGVIVESGFRRGLLLPDIEGVDTVEDQVAIARRKAGIAPSEPVTLHRFTVTRYR